MGATASKSPSFYFKRQCYASVECDEEPAKYAIDYLGNERLVFPPTFRMSIPNIRKRSSAFSNCRSLMKTSEKFSGITARLITASLECNWNARMGHG